MIEADAAHYAVPGLVAAPAGGVTSGRVLVEFGATALKNSPLVLLNSNQ